MGTKVNSGLILLWVMAWSLLMATALCQAAPTPAAAAADFPPSTESGGQRLQLNGTGVRYKAILRVYEAGLYTVAPVQTADEFFALKGPKRLHMVARRDIDANELARMLVRGVSDANPRELVNRQLVGLAQLGEMFASRPQIRSGDTFGFEYLPGVGTRIVVNGHAVGEPVRDPDFFLMIMRLWLGPQPVDTRLKSALLGGPTQRDFSVAQVP
ncbi:hypothetical protein BurJ1DRAFT_2012 [Burkholderiales bacterium JOSHI_001]|nr:hypothetical protein BurJ1DRAFT_2012 [Burkholderiales bacterium JOSHI_001]